MGNAGDVGVINSFTDEYRFMSNFHPAPVRLDNDVYPTVEHAYQAAKSLDAEDRAMIRRMKTAGAAKRAGKTIVLRADWMEVRVCIMRNLLEQKFSDPLLGLFLRRTSPAVLIEGNTWGDAFWGVCNGVGENQLGRLLMEIRANHLNKHP